jgi:hypothetical protein
MKLSIDSVDKVVQYVYCATRINIVYGRIKLRQYPDRLTNALFDPIHSRRSLKALCRD